MQKKIYVTAILTILLVSSVLASTTVYRVNVNGQASSSSNSVLNQYEWPQLQGDSACTRFSKGPGPSTNEIQWKAIVPGVQSYLAAFNGFIYVCTNTSVVALSQDGQIAWEREIPMPRNWPVAYKIDDSHMIVEGTCLDPNTGNILWTSSQFSEDTGIFNTNVYSPEEKMFYVKLDNSYIQAWDFSDPSHPPRLAWETYIDGGGRTGIGVTYGDGKVFTGSFENMQVALDARTGKLLWTTLTKGPMIFTGTYSEGRFFRGGTDENTMYCFNATTGETIWTYTPPTNGYFVTGTAVAYGMVYEMNKDGYLYALDVKTGELVWKYKGPDDTLLWPGMPSIAEGKIYLTTGETAMYGGQTGISEFACINAFTGEAIWKLPIEALAPRESVAIAYGHLYIIPGNVTTAVDSVSGNEYSRNDEVWCIGRSVTVSNWPMWRADPTHSSTAPYGPSNLTMNWKFTTQGSIISSPSVVDGVVYFGSQDKNVYAVGAWSGTLIWKYQTGGLIESSPAIANGKLYISVDDGYLYCLDTSTGRMLWKTFINSDQEFAYGSVVLKSSPAVVGNTVYVGSLDGNMYAIDGNNGNVIWKTPTKGQIGSSPAVANGAVFFTSEEPETGVLYKLDAASGSVIWKQYLPYEYQFTGGNQMLASPSVAAGMVFTVANIRTYYGINETTGAYVWNFTDPWATEFVVLAPIYNNGELYIIDKYDVTSLNAMTGERIWSSFTGDELYISPSYSDGKIYVVTSQKDIFVLDANNKGAKLAVYVTPSSCWSSPTIANGNLYVGCNDWNLYSFSNSYTNLPSTTETPAASTPSPHGFALETYVTYILVIVAIIAIIAVVAAGYFLRKRNKVQTP